MRPLSPHLEKRVLSFSPPASVWSPRTRRRRIIKSPPRLHPPPRPKGRMETLWGIPRAPGSRHEDAVTSQQSPGKRGDGERVASRPGERGDVGSFPWRREGHWGSPQGLSAGPPPGRCGSGETPRGLPTSPPPPPRECPQGRSARSAGAGGSSASGRPRAPLAQGDAHGTWPPRSSPPPPNRFLCLGWRW